MVGVQMADRTLELIILVKTQMEAPAGVASLLQSDWRLQLSALMSALFVLHLSFPSG
jgi:hypothetical protein